MDQQKEKALLGWVSGLIDIESVDSLKRIDYGACFINILQHMDNSATLQEFPSMKDRVMAAKNFLEDFYSVSFCDGKLINFGCLFVPTEPGADIYNEVAKVLLLLLCAGIQDKNPKILTAAMEVDVSLHWDVRKLIEAVVQPDELTTSLPADFAKVFVDHSDQNSSWSSSVGNTPARRLSMPGVRESPLLARITNLNLTSLDDSLQILSPARQASTSSPATPLEELVNSPQLARKLMRREKEHRYRLERQLKEKEGMVKKCQQTLHTETLLREELELDLQETNAQLERKDCRISDLEQQILRMRALQDRLDELGALRDSNLELERDVESLRSQTQMVETLKRDYQALRDENKGLYGEIANLQEQLNSLESAQSEARKAHIMSQKMKGRVAELEAQLEAAHEARDRTNEEKRTLEADIEALKSLVQEQRQQLSERMTSANDGEVVGECMAVVTDRLMEELRAELDTMKNTWTQPEVYAATLQDLETSTAALKSLEEECSQAQQQVQQLGLDAKKKEAELERLNEELDQKDMAYSMLKSELNEKCANYEFLKKVLENKEKECADLREELTDQVSACERLKGDVSEKEMLKTELEKRLGGKRIEIQELEERLVEKEENINHLSQRCGELKVSLEEQVDKTQTAMTTLTNSQQAHEQAVDDFAKVKSSLEDQLQEQASHFASLLEEKESTIHTLELQLEEKHEEVSQLNADVVAEKEKSQTLRETKEQLQGKVGKLVSLNEQLEKLMAGKQADFEQQLHLYSAVEADLTEAQGVIEQYKALAKQAECERDQLQITVDQLRESTCAQVKEAEEKAAAEIQSLKTVYEDAQTDFETKISQLETDVQQNVHLIKNQSAELEQRQELMHSLQDEHRTRVSRLEEALKAKTVELSQQAEKLGSSEQQVQHLQEMVQTLEEALRTAHQKHEDAEKALQNSLKSLQCSATAKEAELQETVSSHRQHITALEHKIAELETEVSHKEKLLQELDAQHKTLQETAKQKQGELEETLRTQIQEMMHGVEKLESVVHQKDISLHETETRPGPQTLPLSAECDEAQENISFQMNKMCELNNKIKLLEAAMNERETAMQDLTAKYESDMENLRQSSALTEEELQESIISHLQKITELNCEVNRMESVIKQTEVALENWEIQHKSELEASQQMASQKEADLLDVINTQKQQLTDLVQKVGSLEDTVKQRTTALQDLESEKLAESHAHTIKMEALAKSAEEREAVLQESVIKCTTQAEDMAKKVLDLETALSEKDSHLQQLESNYSCTKKQYEDLLESHTNKEQEHQTMIETLKQESSAKESETSARLDELNSEIQRLTSVAAEKDMLTSQQEDKLSQSLQSAKEEIDRLNSVALEREQYRVKEEEEWSQKLSSTQQEVLRLKTVLEEKETTMAKHRVELAEELNLARAEIDRLHCEAEQTKTSMAECQEEMLEKLTNAQEEIQNLRSLAADRETAVATREMELSEQLKTTTEENDRLKSESAFQKLSVMNQEKCLSEKINIAEEEIRRLKSEREDREMSATKHSEELSEKLTLAQNEIESLKSEAAVREHSASKDKEKLQEAVTATQEEMRVLKLAAEERELSTAQHTRDLSAKLASAEDEISCLKVAADERTAIFSQCEEKLSEKLMSAQSEVIRAQEMCAARDKELCSILEKVIEATEEKSVDQVATEHLLSGLSELGSASAPSTSQLVQCLEKLVQDMKDTERDAEKKERALSLRICEIETDMIQLQSTLSRVTEESELLRQLSVSKEEGLETKLAEMKTQTTKEIDRYKETLHKLEGDMEKECQALSDQLRMLKVEKQQAEAHVQETEEYWKLQLKNLQEEVESDMKQQRLTFENDFAEQQAEYDSRLNSVLNDQENLRLKQQAETQDKITALEAALATKETEVQCILLDKEELHRNLTAEKAEAERRLANLEQCLQKEKETQHTMQSQMNEDRLKVQQLEERLCVSVQQTEHLQRHVSDLESQKSSAVVKLEQDVQAQHDCVRQREEENHRLQAKIIELEGRMSSQASELNSVKSTLEQQMSHRGEAQARESQLRMEMDAKQQSYEDQIRKLSSRVVAVTADYHSLQAENKTLQESVSETSQTLAEQLKRYERKCKQTETQRLALEDRLKVYVEKEKQWKVDAEKLKEMTERLEELESTKREDNDTMVSAERKVSSNDSLMLTSENLQYYNLESNAQLHLDGSFMNTLPQTPGEGEQHMSVFHSSPSCVKPRNDRHSMYSVNSAKSQLFIPSGAGKMFSCEDEPPESPKFEWGRLNELQRRNTLCLPHMKSSYPIETQTVEDTKFSDSAMQQARYSDIYGGRTSSTSSDTTRKRKPDVMEVDSGPVHPVASDSQSRKLARHGPVYQKPGPPTPTHSRSQKLSGKDGKKSGTPRRTPRRSPRLRSTPRRSPVENLIANPRRESIAFDVGFSPVKGSGLRRMTRQKGFISKSKLPDNPRKGDSNLMPAPSVSSTATSSKTKSSAGGKPPRPLQAKESRKPLGVRNSLHGPR